MSQKNGELLESNLNSNAKTSFQDGSSLPEPLVEYPQIVLENYTAEQFRLLVENARDHVIFTTTTQGIITTWNPGVQHILGYHSEEWVGQSADIIFTREDREQKVPEAEMARARERGHSDDIRWHLKKDGTLFWAEGSMVALRDREGKLHGFGKIMRDATERKQAQTALSDAEKRLASVIGTAMDGILTAGEDQRILSCNPAALEMFGYEEQEVIGQRLEVLMPDQFRSAHSGHVQRFQHSGKTHLNREAFGILTARRKDGTGFPIEASVSRFQDAEGRTTFAAFIRDISERIAAESALREALARESARAEREELINKIADGIRQSLPPEEIETIAVAELGQALHADRCYVFTIDTAHDTLLIAREWHREGTRSLSGEYRLSSLGIDVDDVFRSQKTLVVPHLQGGERLSDQNADTNQSLNLSSLINVPFYEGGKFVGALAVAMIQESRQWTETEIKLTEMVADQLRSTMEAARLQQRERNIAAQLQDALIPPIPQSLPGMQLASFYRPALQEAGVGGDFFDVFPVGKGCTGLVVADLSGKGLQAASAVATCRNMIRYAIYTATRTATSLAESITALNGLLVEHDLLRGFATAFLGLYDHEQKTLTYVNCGQEPGLLYRACTADIKELVPTGPVLGGFGDGKYEQKKVKLSKGDVLALFTDGMTEVGPSRRELLEIEGLTVLFAECCDSAASICSLSTNTATGFAALVKDRLVAEVEAYAGVATRWDDIALLVGVVME